MGQTQRVHHSGFIPVATNTVLCNVDSVLCTKYEASLQRILRRQADCESHRWREEPESTSVALGCPDEELSSSSANMITCLRQQRSVAGFTVVRGAPAQESADDRCRWRSRPRADSSSRHWRGLV